MGGDVKRFRRWLFNFAAVVSLILCVSALAMAARSAFKNDHFHRYYFAPNANGFWHGQDSVYSYEGRLCFAGSRFWFSDPVVEDRLRSRRLAQRGWWYESKGASNSIRSWLSFLLHRVSAPGESNWTIEIPYWALIVMTGLSAWWCSAGFRQRRRRSIQGLCPVCGYDLRATPDRCPECGTAVEPKAGAGEGHSGGTAAGE
jgi:hypothetical protein